MRRSFVRRTGGYLPLPPPFLPPLSPAVFSGFGSSAATQTSIPSASRISPIVGLFFRGTGEPNFSASFSAGTSVHSLPKTSPQRWKGLTEWIAHHYSKPVKWVGQLRADGYLHTLDGIHEKQT